MGNTNQQMLDTHQQQLSALVQQLQQQQQEQHLEQQQERHKLRQQIHRQDEMLQQLQKQKQDFGILKAMYDELRDQNADLKARLRQQATVVPFQLLVLIIGANVIVCRKKRDKRMKV